MRRILLSIGLIVLASPAWASAAPANPPDAAAQPDKPAASAPADSAATDTVVPFPGMTLSLIEGALVLSKLFNRVNLETKHELDGERYFFTTRPDGHLIAAVSPRGPSA